MSFFTSREILFCLFLFFISLFVRFYGYPHRNGWSADTARDLLAGYLIQYESARPSLGHFNSGMGVPYPPYYYYVVSLVTAITNDYRQTMAFFVFIHSFDAVLFYLIAKEFFTKKTAAITASLFCVHPYLLQISLDQLSCNVSFSLFLYALFFFSKFVKTKNYIFYSISLIIIIFCSTIFFANIFFVVPLMVFPLFEQRNISKKNLLVLGATFYASVIIFLLLFLPVLQSPHFLRTSISNQTTAISLSALGLIPEIMSMQLSNYFLNSTLLASMSFLTLCIVITYRKRCTAYFTITFLIIETIHLFLFSFQKNHFAHYLVLMTPFLFLCLAEIIDELRRLNKHVAVITILVWISFTTDFQLKMFFYSASEYRAETYEALALRIKNYSFDRVEIISQEDDLRWNNRRIWYFLRDRLLFDVEGENSQLEIIGENKNILWICEERTKENRFFCFTETQSLSLSKVGEISIDGVIFNLYYNSV